MQEDLHYGSWKIQTGKARGGVDNLKRFIISGVVVIIIVLVAVVWWSTSLSPVDANNKETKPFIITSGDGVREIAKKLHDQNLIRDQIAFFLLIKQLGLEKRIQAGSFVLSPSMTASELANTLTVGREDVKITIPEGLRSEQILDLLAMQKVDEGNWTPLSEIDNWKADEGKYFPETYLVPRTWTIDQIREHLRKTFDQKFDAKMIADAKSQGLTPDEAVILASIVEREAQTDQDMPIVAGILLNRLNDNHPLQVDATIHYMLGTAKNGWWPKEVLSEDVKIPSPYNTYLNTGLPPTPIGNPGMTSLRAVIYPTDSNYYYYISDKDGKMRYAKTLEEHNANIAKYLR